MFWWSYDTFIIACFSGIKKISCTFLLWQLFDSYVKRIDNNFRISENCDFWYYMTHKRFCYCSVTSVWYNTSGLSITTSPLKATTLKRVHNPNFNGLRSGPAIRQSWTWITRLLDRHRCQRVSLTRQFFMYVNLCVSLSVNLSVAVSSVCVSEYLCEWLCECVHFWI